MSITPFSPQTPTEVHFPHLMHMDPEPISHPVLSYFQLETTLKMPPAVDDNPQGTRFGHATSTLRRVCPSIIDKYPGRLLPLPCSINIALIILHATLVCRERQTELAALCVRGMRRRDLDVHSTHSWLLQIYFYTHIDTTYTENAFFSFII